MVGALQSGPFATRTSKDGGANFASELGNWGVPGTQYLTPLQYRASASGRELGETRPSRRCPLRLAETAVHESDGSTRQTQGVQDSLGAEWQVPQASANRVEQCVGDRRPGGERGRFAAAENRRVRAAQ